MLSAVGVDAGEASASSARGRWLQLKVTEVMPTGAPLGGGGTEGGSTVCKHRTRAGAGLFFCFFSSACGVAAQEGVKHGQLHALLVPPTPRHHRALAVGRVEVVAVARVRQAKGGERRRG